MKSKVQVHRRAEEVVDVDDVVADVERNQCQPATRQHLPELSHDSAELGGVEMHDRIEGNKPYKARRWQAELPHVARPKVETRIEAYRALDHFWREINADDRHALIMKVLRNVSGTAANIRDEPSTACFLGESIQKMPVERLLGQLRGQMLSVGFGRRVVTFTNIHGASALNVTRQEVVHPGQPGESSGCQVTLLTRDRSPDEHPPECPTHAATSTGTRDATGSREAAQAGGSGWLSRPAP